jgi:hypothetical protein
MTQSGYPDFAGNTYREIGHYIVRFAALIDAMRNRLATQLTWGIKPPNPVPYIVMGEMTAMPMANAFFGACRSVAKLEDSELRVERILISQVQEQIKFRNDIAHGDWEVDAWQYARTPPGVSELYRLAPTVARGTSKRPTSVLRRSRPAAHRSTNSEIAFSTTGRFVSSCMTAVIFACVMCSSPTTGS